METLPKSAPHFPKSTFIDLNAIQNYSFLSNDTQSFNIIPIQVIYKIISKETNSLADGPDRIFIN